MHISHMLLIVMSMRGKACQVSGIVNTKSGLPDASMFVSKACVLLHLLCISCYLANNVPCYFGTSPVRMLASHFLSYRFTFLYNKIATKPYFLVLCHFIIIIHLDHIIIIIHLCHFIIIIHSCRIYIIVYLPTM